jgi:ADP-ribose pyrophosphatase
MSDKDIVLVRRETPFRGYFRIDRYTVRHRLFAGGTTGDVVREVFERGHAAAVLPYDPVRDAVVLIEQFRIGAYAAGRDPWLVEIVAGIIETGETPEAVARREAVEEAGLAVTELLPICDIFVSPGGTTETLTLLCGRCDATGAGGIHGVDDEDEDIRVFVQPFSDALDAVRTGAIRSAPAVIALQWLALNRDDVRARWRA